jgi:flagellar biosynthesis GTPase FlhF
MDIDLLSKMVKELILDNKRVVLPGLGSFVAEIVPASFSDKGYTINPPYRKLYFRSKPDEGSDLIPFYAKSNSVSEEIAERVIVDFVTELKTILFHKKTIIFPGLGRLRATKENNVFFVADEDLDIYPEGFGLEPISLKTHQATVAEVKEAVSDLKSILTEPELQPEKTPEMEPIVEVDVEEVIEPVAEVTEEVPVEPESTNEDAAETAEAATVEVEQEEKPSAEEAEEDSDGGPEELVEEEAEEVAEEVVVEEVAEEMVEEPEIEELPTAELVEDDAAEELSAIPVKKSFWKTLLKVVMWIIISLVLLTAAYVAVAHICPQWIDQFLYTPEELELLDNIY